MSTENSIPESAGPASVLLVVVSQAQFQLGQLLATPGAMRAIKIAQFSAAALVSRHMCGDFGDCGEEDRQTNAEAVKHGYRILSVYRLVDAAKLKATPVHKRHELPTVWIITESDRRSTTLLLPEEY